MKAVLVIDVPNSCDDCELNRCYNDIHIYCNQPCNTARCGEIVPEWCPLRPLPHSKQIENRWFSDDYSKGWNDCLDAIMGETE